MKVSSVCVFVFWIALVLYWFFTRNGGNTPPGPIGLPYVGYLPFLSPKPYLDFQRLARIYGPIFSVRLGTALLVVVDELEPNKKIFFVNDPFTLIFNRTIEEDDDILGSIFATINAQLYELIVPPRRRGNSRIKYWDHLQAAGTSGDAMIHAFFIPKHTFIVMNIWSEYHSREKWGEDYSDFNPRRFISENNKTLLKPTDFSINLDSWARIKKDCLFARIFYAFVTILKKFLVTAPERKLPLLEEKFNWCLTPQKQELRLIRRH
nr:carnosic acid synthase-like [Parasteatoda tepidariorum]